MKEYIETLEDLTDEKYGYDISNLSNYDWMSISDLDNLSEKFIEDNIDNLYFNVLNRSDSMTENLIEKYQDKFLELDWITLVQTRDLSKEFIVRNYERFVPETLLEHQTVPASIIYKLLLKEPFLSENVVSSQTLTTKIIKAMVKTDTIDWYEVSKVGKLTNKAIIENEESIRWDILLRYQDVSEKVMKSCERYIHWNLVSKYQAISKEFIVENSKNINIEFLKQNVKVNQEELEKEEVYTLISLLKVM